MLWQKKKYVCEELKGKFVEETRLTLENAQKSQSASLSEYNGVTCTYYQNLLFKIVICHSIAGFN